MKLDFLRMGYRQVKIFYCPSLVIARSLDDGKAGWATGDGR